MSDRQDANTENKVIELMPVVEEEEKPEEQEKPEEEEKSEEEEKPEEEEKVEEEEKAEVEELKNMVVKALGVNMITKSNLTEAQKKLATHIYNTVSAAIKNIVSDKSLNNIIKVTRVIGQVIKELENTTIDGHKAKGTDKKAVAIELGRIIIKETVEDETCENGLLSVYDLLADNILEAMMDVSKVVNTIVQKAATSCCPGLFKFPKLF